MVEAVAEATQTDASMASTTALGVLSAACGGRAIVQVRKGWSEGINLYTATIASPGERKSAVQSAMIAPIAEAEQQLVNRMKPRVREAETRRAIAEKSAERATRAAGNTDAGDGYTVAVADAIGAVEAAACIDVPTMPRLLVDDTTPEALASLLAEQRGRIAVISAEGGIFDTIAGRYTAVPSLDVFLKGHSGDLLRVDRKGRPPEHVERPALTMSLMIQPEVLSSIGMNVVFRGRGLLARFLYCRPPSRIGQRESNPLPVSDAIRCAYHDFVLDLVLSCVERTDPMTIVLEAEAHRAVIELDQEIEPELAGAGALATIADWGAKYVGTVCRIAGLLHIAERGDAAPRTPMPAETMHRAISIGRYYKDQSIAAFAEMKVDPSVRLPDFRSTSCESARHDERTDGGA